MIQLGGVGRPVVADLSLANLEVEHKSVTVLHL